MLEPRGREGAPVALWFDGEVPVADAAPDVAPDASGGACVSAGSVRVRLARPLEGELLLLDSPPYTVELR